MSHELGNLLNRIGMVLGFLSFWLIAPELIGEHRLQSWERSFAKTLSWLVYIGALLAVIVLEFIVYAFIYYIVVYLIRSSRGAALIEALPDTLVGIFFVVAVWLFADLYDPLAERLVSRLANDARVRRRALLFGAALFIVAFLLEFAATFQGR
jgi:hypothetical protein